MTTSSDRRHRTRLSRASSFARPAFAAILAVAICLFAAGTARAATATVPPDEPERSLTAPPRLDAGQEGDPDDTDTVELAGLLRLALDDNPEIRAAAERHSAARERPSQAGSLPDPMIVGSYRNVGFPRLSLGDEMMSMAGFKVTQPIPYPGKRSLRAAVAEGGAEVAAARVELVRRRVVLDVTRAYYELRFLDQSVDIVRQTRDWLDELERTAEARYAVGEGIQQDVLKAQVEVSSLLERLVQLRQERDSVETRINRLLHRSVVEPVARPRARELPPFEFDHSSLQREAKSASAFLRERALRVVRDETAVRLAVKERKPDFQLSSGWMSRGELPDVWEVNVGISLPIYRDTKQDRAVAESEAELRGSREQHVDAIDMVEAAVRDAYLQANRAHRLVRLYGEAIIPQATLSLESATAGYEVGKVDFLTVIDNVVTLLTFQIEYHRQEMAYMQALARIEEHLGRSLGATPNGIWKRAAPGLPEAGDDDASRAAATGRARLDLSLLPDPLGVRSELEELGGRIEPVDEEKPTTSRESERERIPGGER